MIPALGRSLVIAAALCAFTAQAQSAAAALDDGPRLETTPAPDPKDTPKMAQCRALLAPPFPIAQFEALFKTTLILDVKRTTRECMYGYFDKAHPDAGALLVLSFSPRDYSLKNYELAKTLPRGEAPHPPGTVFDLQYLEFGLYFVQALTDDQDWVVVATSRKQALPEATALAINFMKTAPMQNWARLPE
ncbi:hypothetical protein [Duganella sp. S19_KUP01_CR8]|uniref:hypothetical protein n=1 Tax=Duganella sp. S19_KUP01_CR8 TaxID=3025502 RepID=UPI002FCD8C41